MFTDIDSMMAACVSGAGIAHVEEIGIRHLVKAGNLVQILSDWPDEVVPLQAIHPTRHIRAPKVSAFIDFCLQRMR